MDQFGVLNPKIQEQSNLLFSAILKEQQKFDAIKKPDDKHSKVSDELLEEYAKLKGRGFFFKYYSTGRGHGPFTELVDGSVKYDLIAAMGPNLLGHSHPLYIKAHIESACTTTMMCGNLLSHNEPHKLTKRLLDQVSNTRLKHFWFAGSGSFANDNALKMIWQKKAPAYKLIAFEKAFAGRSIATQDITFNPAYREGMPCSIQVDHVPHFDHNDPENSLKKTIHALNKLIADEPNAHGAIMLELVQGEGGFIYGTKEYYQGVCQWAKDNGLYVWFDEIQTFARTTELFAFQTFELDQYADVVTIGKVLQACGTLFIEELNPKPGLIAGTFNGAIAALNAGEKIIHYLTSGNFYGEKGRHKYLQDTFLNRLEELSKKTNGKVGYCGGVGTMISFEVGDSSKEISAKFIKRLFENGIISYTAGKDPVRVRFLMPTCLTNEHIDEIFSIIEKTVNEVID